MQTIKKIMLYIGLGLIFTIAISTACHAQENYMQQKGFIDMHINVYQDNEVLNDTNTIVTIDCLTEKIKFNNHSSNFDLILHPNEEYNLTFKRSNCISKTIYITTANIDNKNNYIINANIKLISGSPKEYIYGGKVYYNKHKNNFECMITNIIMQDLTTKICKK